MWNHGGLGLHFIFLTAVLVAITKTSVGARNRNITAACFEHERLALLKFKHSVIDDYDMLSSWAGNDCCRWERVMCDGVTGNVESLFIGAEHFDYYAPLVSNEVSSSLEELRHLKYLDLSLNRFRGSSIPKFIGSLKQLIYLNLSRAQFSGIIPHHIGNLSNLKILDLSSNQYHQYHQEQLMARDMVWIKGLSSLEHLDLSYVNLNGAKNLDMVIYMIPSLKVLSLSTCGLSDVDLGSLRNSNTTLSNIKHFDLSYNSFKGVLPHFLQNMSSLKFLDLSLFNLSMTWNFANLISMVPSLLELHLSNCNLEETHLSHSHINFTTLSNIQHLDLSHNFFPGRFPSVLTNMTSLRVLDISSSSLNSSVPIMPNLLELDLSSNEFEKLEDVGIWRQCHLKQVSLMYNAFNMELTDQTTNISECAQYAFEMLFLSLSLNGTFPESLGRMTNLRHLDLSYNQLTGIIPESLGRLRLLQVLDLSVNLFTNSIPKSLGRLRSLQKLNLAHNKLTGPVPTFQGNLTELDLSFNDLNGSIPESWGRLVTLTYLSLEENKLTGPIPTSIGRLVSLESFSVSSNFLSGTIPVSIGQLTKLQYFDVSNNSLEGVVSEAHFNLSMLKSLYVASNTKLTFNISSEWLPPFQLIAIDLSYCKIANRFPRWLRNQRKLAFLDLSNAYISGPLPTWLRKMPIICFINLSHNNLSGRITNLPSGGTEHGISYPLLSLNNNVFNGSIPRSLCKWKHLYALNLSKNKLTGKIPNCLKNLRNLYVLMLSSNGLSGVIPSFIMNLSSLGTLHLNDNNFNGELSQDFWNLSELMVLDLGDNALCGEIPKWIGEKLKLLRVFRLRKNNFTGEIPRSLCSNDNVRILDVAHNKLTGTIPRCLGELQGMVYYNEHVTQTFTDAEEVLVQEMKGSSLEYTKTWQLVINMDLSSNKFIGELPVELTALGALMGLNISNNHLTGGIPEDIGNMKALTSLDFSGNELSGLIPPSIASLNLLSHLNLSNNNLSGRIPTGNQLQTLLDPSIYAGNKYLCGAPLPKNCSDPEDPTTTSKKKYGAADEPNKVWFYVDLMCGFATGFWGVVTVLVWKKQWRHKLFVFAEKAMDKIHVVVMVRINKMKRGRKAI